MSQPFQPIGELARWRMLVDAFREVDRGDTLTYKALAEVLGLDEARDIRAIRAAVRQASRALSRDHDRSLIAVRGVGYRVALPDEHLDLAGRQQRKSGKALVRARSHVENVDLSGMTDDGRRLIHAAATVLAYQQAQIRSLDLRQKDLARVVDSVVNKQEMSDERLSKLEQQIAKLDT